MVLVCKWNGGDRRRYVNKRRNIGAHSLEREKEAADNTCCCNEIESERRTGGGRKERRRRQARRRAALSLYPPGWAQTWQSGEGINSILKKAIEDPIVLFFLS